MTNIETALFEEVAPGFVVHGATFNVKKVKYIDKCWWLLKNGINKENNILVSDI